MNLIAFFELILPVSFRQAGLWLLEKSDIELQTVAQCDIFRRILGRVSLLFGLPRPQATLATE